MKAVHILFVMVIALLVGACSPSELTIQRKALSVSLTTTKGVSHLVLKERQKERLECVSKADTRPSALVCIQHVEKRYSRALGAVAAYLAVLDEWSLALLLYQDGKLTKAELVRLGFATLKNYGEMRTALDPLGIKLPELTPAKLFGGNHG